MTSNRIFRPLFSLGEGEGTFPPEPTRSANRGAQRKSRQLSFGGGAQGGIPSFLEWRIDGASSVIACSRPRIVTCVLVPFPFGRPRVGRRRSDQSMCPKHRCSDMRIGRYRIAGCFLRDCGHLPCRIATIVYTWSSSPYLLLMLYSETRRTREQAAVVATLSPPSPRSGSLNVSKLAMIERER